MQYEALQCNFRQKVCKICCCNLSSQRFVHVYDTLLPFSRAEHYCLMVGAVGSGYELWPCCYKLILFSLLVIP